MTVTLIQMMRYFLILNSLCQKIFPLNFLPIKPAGATFPWKTVNVNFVVAVKTNYYCKRREYFRYSCWIFQFQTNDLEN
jgi:hypothetical protein